LKNIIVSIILCCGLLFSCGGLKKTSQFDESQYDDKISENLIFDETEVVEEISQDVILENKFRYENAIYNPSIRSVQLHPLRFEMGNPLIHLSFKDSLLLSFDDLIGDPQNYAYTLIHCNADWTPSDLMESEYLEGFYEVPITDYQFSFNTIQNYVHYQTVIPSANLKPTLSGNYLLIVFLENQKDQPILSQRMMIIEEKVSVKGSVKRATALEQRNYQHEIDFSIHHSGYEIDNPFSDIMPIITQNSRWDNVISGLQAVFVKDDEIVYDYEDENLFDGGNEYRFFDIQSLRYLSERLANISFETDTHKVVLRTDEARRFQRYSGLVQDINGKRLIRVQEGSRNAIEADYALVRFTLPYEYEISHGDLYVFGQISDYVFPESHRMTYNTKKNYYEANIYLKQGYYNYEYVLKKYEGGNINRFIEGTHYQTVNDYHIYIYHRPTGESYDQLIGIQKLTSKDLL
tara:strand:+ start:3493 stop:4878 length:1386 start_codon:yes stop_codon:yes gene_type:complete